MYLTELTAGSPSAPPSRPWVEILANEDVNGYVAVYYSDRTSRFAVREVTRPGDNKSDPNIETGTFGLFSTCERSMRSGVQIRQANRLFFVTSHQGCSRALTGYYALGWWAWGRLSGTPRDVCLAAREMWFVEHPIPLNKLPEPAQSSLSTHFRTTKRVESEVARQLESALRAQPDATSSYIEEIDRLERFNRHYTGFRCWQRTKPFSWSGTRRLVSARPVVSGARAIRNSSPTGRWACRVCSYEFPNQSRLKECPACQRLDTLEPAA